MEKNWRNLTGWLVFLVGFVVYFLTAERAGSLWDCGEFVSAAYKLQVVHPPGAPFFILVGRIFSLIGDMLSTDPRGAAFAVNLMSGTCTALAAAFVCWSTSRLVRHLSNESIPTAAQSDNASIDFTMDVLVPNGAGLVAGLCVIFSSSIWFSAVEGEVYAMSLAFMALTLWAAVKWYTLPDERRHDRWLVVAMFAIGLSIGVHLLSLLILPVVAMLFYFKRYNKESFWQIGLAAVAGAFIIGLIQKLIIVGIPALWLRFELFSVNTLGLPYHSGLFFALAIVAAVVVFGLRYAHKNGYGGLQLAIVSALMIAIGYSTIGMVVIRANTKPPINMNDNYDITRLLPYINREQYGERPLLKGVQFNASPINSKTEDRYGRTENGYEVTDQKVEYVYNESDKVLFPRMSSPQSKDHGLYKNVWMQRPEGQPTSADNYRFFFKYQLGWMYWRYFFWNFVGRQNFDQGFLYMDKASGHWLSGIKPIDEARLYDMSLEPDHRKNNPSRNKYYGIPFLLGLIGIFFHFKRNRKDAYALMAAFVISGVGLIVYSNQPPLEPRERDYVLVGSFMIFCMWIGMSIPALVSFLKKYISPSIGAPSAIGLALVAPILMGSQNWDDHTRRHLLAASELCGANYLNSCDENAILLTYGDNDTYPVWYAQEVEDVRTDVRPINLSLIGIDYYVEAQRRKINTSERVDMITPDGSYSGNKRNYIPVQEQFPIMSLQDAMKWVGESHPLRTQGGSQIESFFPTKKVFINVDKAYWYQNLPASARDTSDILDRIEFDITSNNLYKGDLAVLDMLAANFNKRPIYYTSSSREKTFGLNKHFQMEGIVNKLVPVNTGGQQIDNEKSYDLIMNTFKWGNFDKYEMYADEKLNASYYAHSNTFMLTASSYGQAYQNLQNRIKTLEANKNTGEDVLESLRRQMAEAKQKCTDVCSRYYEVFPPKSFGYGPVAPQLFNYLTVIDDKETVEKYFPGYVEYLRQHLEFYSNMDPVVLQESQTFRGEYNNMRQLPAQLQSMISRLSDGNDLEALVNTALLPYAQNPNN